MPTCAVAINLEPEENIDEQIDTTKELQVDEALKRFQNALKLQAQGVRSRDAAGAAYKELFESEIFKYREARTEYERAALQLEVSGQPEVTAPELFSEGLDIGAGGADGVAANLSLALYLSYKNYGHYFLDKLKDDFDSDPEWRKRHVIRHGREGNRILDNWTAALDQDPSDPELWRRAARIAAAMNSGRIKRYCLEAAIEMDDDPAVDEVQPPSLAESLAGQQLKDHLQFLGDGMALSHPVMLPWLRRSMPALLKRHLDPIPFLPDPTLQPTAFNLTANGLPEAMEEEAVTEKRSKRRLFHITKNLLETIGVEDREAFQHLDGILDLCVAEDRTSKITCLMAKDLRSFIANFNAETAMVLLNKKEQATLGLSSFLEHAKTGSQDRIVTAPFNEVKGLKDFAGKMAEHRELLTSQDIAFEWLKAISSTYTETRWSETMKATVVQMLNSIDPFLYQLVRAELEKPTLSGESLAPFEPIVPMILELRIDIYERITNASSTEDYATRMDAKYRLDRWLDIASLYVSLLDRPATDAVCENVEPIHLPNNLIMTTISPAAADREISKLTTMDFFLSLFQEGMEDPVHVIETLEPVLNPSTVFVIDAADAHEESPPSPADSEASTMIVDELHGKVAISESLDELLIQALTLALNDNSAFDIIDNDHLQSSSSALAKVSCLLHVAFLCEDEVMRMEILKNKNIENWEDHLGQVVYDLYGLKLGAGPTDFQDHGCPAEKLEKRQTMQLVEKVMILADRMSMKDLLKSELKNTIEHMQQTLGQPKSTSQMIHNLRNFSEQLKKPIHPLRLYQALNGDVSVDAVATNTPEASLAKHGWFFLLGMIALSKFKAVDLNRRQTPGATGDLRIGATFLRLQLQFTAERWEAWFRLAECFDYELDEAVLWTADKMNKDRPELVKFQRNAIHCYTLALSHSRFQDICANDGDPLHDLYHKFGMRLYASSREPFAMEPFEHADHERFFIESTGSGTFKRILHQEMSEYKAWKFAAKLFRMAMERDPNNWKNPYMLAKCYWKMYQTPLEKLEETDKKAKITAQKVLDALQRAINVAYHARKSRHSDPILEPHYKIVSILWKLVTRKEMPAKEAADLLSEQPFGVPLNPDDDPASFAEPEDWEEYIIRNLAKLKEKDKSNWQHRIVARHAKIVFDERKPESVDEMKVEAKAAFGILRENIFTKTMVMNVWKCDAERPGRHHVFTEQYVRFMTRILVILSDRTNLEQLLRRLRKKGADFYHFTDLWQSCCNAYLKLLRQEHHIEPFADETFKAMSPEEFEIVSERITDWAAGDDAEVSAFLCMKEAIELKKLNANLIKVAVIDDLINDCYSKIYLDVASTLPGIEPSKVAEERNSNTAKETAAQPEAAAQADAKASSSLNSILNPPSAQESHTGSATPLDPEKSEKTPKVRKTGVRRADILRKAEQAVVRSMEMPKLAHHGRSRIGSLSSGKRGSQTPVAGGSDADSDDEDGPERQVRREAGEDLDADGEGTHLHEEGGDEGEGDEAVENSKMEDRTELESEAGSIHDDADDESDLSDVPEGYDDDVPPGLLFPNLIRRAIRSAETSGEDADSESEGDETDEPEDEEDSHPPDNHIDIPEARQQSMTIDSHHTGGGAVENDDEETGMDGDTEMVDADLTFSADDTIELGHSLSARFDSLELTGNRRSALIIGCCILLGIVILQLLVILVNVLGRNIVMSGIWCLVPLVIVGGLAMVLVGSWFQKTAPEQLEDDGEARPLLSRDDDELLPVGWSSSEVIFDFEESNAEVDLERRIRPHDYMV
ncbi:Histone transcription regulator 3 -like protein [Escovopsis weberi]|uniref:Histone transcription regulator 3 homolog n=1 Tax=Escovopsis weberi TaxID=150374 RepID=A0A0M9VWS1_ESCWE|nr:Histone transcription regulator 3 -like protein [Escovopsis weberi]